VDKGHASPLGRARILFALPSGGSAAFCGLAGVFALAVGGCGSSSPAVARRSASPSPLAAVCTAGARAAIGAFLRASPASIVERASISNQAVPQCVYRVAGRAVRVTAILDTGPQPYFRLERTAIEAGQQFGTVRVEPAPQNVPGLGIEAAWFPGERHVMATDGRRLITAAVTWRHASATRERALAVATARSYLRGPAGRAVHGYPGG
jgi:hypothetical protein